MVIFIFIYTFWSANKASIRGAYLLLNFDACEKRVELNNFFFGGQKN
jgi:hypothetical protein